MPVNELEIERLGPKGDGIHLRSRIPIYVDRALPGDRVKARIFRDGALSRGEVVKILAPSPYRQVAPCPHFEQCGSCTLQHLAPDYYQQWKVEMVRDALQKQEIRPRSWLAPVFLGKHNRRRVTFSALKNRNHIVMGYYRRRSDEIVDVQSCEVAEPTLLSLREKIKRVLPDILTEGRTTDIFLQLVGEDVDMVINGPVGRTREPDALVRNAIDSLMHSTPISRVHWRAFGQTKFKRLAKRREIQAKFGPLSVNLPPGAFLQPTQEGERALLQTIFRGLPPKGKFADLFSGCGTFSGPMLERGAVDSYEFDPNAVLALSKASGKQPLRVFRRDLFRNPLRREEINRYDAIVLDPPRGGCVEQVTAMASARTRTVISVSCNPATFARDARILCQGGYRLQTVQVIDQFLWSHHIEVVGVFTK